MQYKYYFKAVHCTLIDIHADNTLFSSLPIMLSRDFTQILPVV